MYDFKLWTDEAQANWRIFEKRVVSFLLIEGTKTGLLPSARRKDLEEHLADMQDDLDAHRIDAVFRFRRENDERAWDGLDLRLKIELDDNHEKRSELRKNGGEVHDRHYYELKVDFDHYSGSCADCTEYRRFGEALATVAGLGEQIRGMYLESGLRDGVGMYDKARVDESNRRWTIRHDWSSCLESDLRERIETEFAENGEVVQLEMTFTAKERRVLKEAGCLLKGKKNPTRNKCVRVEHRRGKPSLVRLTRAGKTYFETFVWNQEEAEAA